MNFAFILLQLSQPVADTAAAATAAAEAPSLSLFELLIKGGWVMIPILILSLVAVYLFVERFLYIRSATKIDPNFIPSLQQKLRQGDMEGALTICKSQHKPIGRIVERGIHRIGTSIRDIESAVENTAKVEVSYLEKNLNILAGIAAIAPMFGFLGTVTGMLKAFYNISLADNISIGVIASGIYEKMITSATGLMVGVMAYIFYTVLTTLIDRGVSRLEVTASEFMDVLFKSERNEFQEK